MSPSSAQSGSDNAAAVGTAEIAAWRKSSSPARQASRPGSGPGRGRLVACMAALVRCPPSEAASAYRSRVTTS
jgi:hypothetical protein